MALQWNINVAKYLICQCCYYRPARLLKTFCEMSFPENLKCRFCFVDIVFVNHGRIMWWCHELDFVIIEHLYAKGQSDLIGCSCNEMGHWACGVLDSFHWCQHQVGCCVWRILIPPYEKNRWQRDFWGGRKDGNLWWTHEFNHSWEDTV